MIKRLVRTASVLAGVAVLSVGMAGTVGAQETIPPRYQQVISANPFGLLLEVFNAEYERVVSESSTAGIGGSYFSRDDNNYLNADLFWRFYPQGNPLDGWAFGAKVGITSVADGTYPGFGFDANRSWLLGKNSNFYVGVGFGLKRLLGVDDDDDIIEYIPTFRIVNIGIAF
jgi:hypothetical protein